VALIGGGVFVASRQQAANRAAAASGKPKAGWEDDVEGEYEEVGVLAAGAASISQPARAEVRPPAAVVSPAASSSSASASMLLQGLKDELFELEVEHKQGRISQQEYESAKAALDQTLQRALKRAAQKV